MPEKARQKLMERLYAGQQLHRQKLVHAEELFTADQRRKAALAENRRGGKSGVPMKRGLKNGSARMPPVLRRKYAGRQNRHAVRQKRNV